MAPSLTLKLSLLGWQRVGPLYLAQTQGLLSTSPRIEGHDLVLPDGEKYKDVPTLMRIVDKALSSRLDRKATFVALGGGVIGDMVGFAAAIYQRGVNFIQVRRHGSPAYCGGIRPSTPGGVGGN